MKAPLRFVIALALILSLLPLFPAAPAHAKTVKNLTWKNFIYSLTDNQITITGLTEDTTGAVTIPNRINGSLVVAIQNYAFVYAEGITSLNTGGSVTSIGDFAFEYCSNLTEVTIGKSVSHIGDFAFKDCPKLSKINVVEPNPTFSSSYSGVLYNKNKTELIKAPPAHKNRCVVPDTVKTIRAYAFEFCRQLSGVTMGSGVTTVGDYAFRCCTAMNNLTIGSNVKSIGKGAFSSCPALTAIHIPSSVTAIGVEAFCGCSSVKELTIGDGIRTIPEEAFSQLLSLEKLTFGSNVTTIGKNAFFRSESLTSVSIPDSVTQIDTRAFSYCYSLADVTMGSGVRSIGDRVFLNSGLERITFRGAAPAFHADAFYGQAATARYPYPDDSWTEKILQDYGGEITWEAYLDPARTAHIQGTLGYTGSGPASLSLWEPGAPSASYTVTAGSGKYRIENILPGEYIFKAEKQNHVTLEYPFTATPGKTVTQNITLRLLGDVRADGSVNIGDVAMLYAHVCRTQEITDAYTLLCADCTGDGKVNIADPGRLYAHITQTLSLYS